MRDLIFIGFLCTVILISGCIEPQKPFGQIGNDSSSTTGNPSASANQQGNAAVILPASARGGLSSAQSALPSYIKDAVLVSISASCDPDGASSQWAYSFDSYDRKKNLEVLIAGQPAIRDGSYSFQDPVGDSWVDSPDATRACGFGGECYLETRNGAVRWTILGDNGQVCQVDAITGKMIQTVQNGGDA